MRYGFAPAAVFPLSYTANGKHDANGENHVKAFQHLGFYLYHFELASSTPAGTVCAFQTSTNLVNWNTLFTLTNNGSVCDYNNNYAQSRARFYRLQPQ